MFQAEPSREGSQQSKRATRENKGGQTGRGTDRLPSLLSLLFSAPVTRVMSRAICIATSAAAPLPPPLPLAPGAGGGTDARKRPSDSNSDCCWCAGVVCVLRGHAGQADGCVNVMFSLSAGVKMEMREGGQVRTRAVSMSVRIRESVVRAISSVTLHFAISKSLRRRWVGLSESGESAAAERCCSGSIPSLKKPE